MGSCLVTLPYDQGILSLLGGFAALQHLTLSQLQLSTNFSEQRVVCRSCFQSLIL